ncbi:nucleolar protein 12-like [Curcuma longa]|uniref:nucleolar protein 12-like n=1 Tax=Curcuma longa TaxID=136217 RepID=UPI003D9F3C8F
MGKKNKKDSGNGSDVIQSLFSADNPFRRTPQQELPIASPAPELLLAEQSLDREDRAGVDVAVARKRKRDKVLDSTFASVLPEKRVRVGDEKEEKRKKRKKAEIEEAYEKRKYGVEENASEGGERVAAFEKRRKAEDSDSSEQVVPEKSFDDESKLARTIFVGNLPLKTTRKALSLEFIKFGQIESVRIRSVPIVDTKVPRKVAILKGKVNDAVDRVNAYIVFKNEQSAKAALSLNMTLFGGNHIRVDTASPPRKQEIGEASLYERKKTVFVGNVPFDVKDEELYQLFCGSDISASNVEAIRVVRDPHTSLGKGIAYILFKTRAAANSAVWKKDWKIRNRALRVCHAKAVDAKAPSVVAASRTRNNIPQTKNRLNNSGTSGEKTKLKEKVTNVSYQGMRSSKFGAPKKSKFQSRPSSQGGRKIKRDGEPAKMTHEAKRPAVAARKAKQLQKKKGQMASGMPADNRMKKKGRKH